jgi:hypothetical protein
MIGFGWTAVEFAAHLKEVGTAYKRGMYGDPPPITKQCIVVRDRTRVFGSTSVDFVDGWDNAGQQWYRPEGWPDPPEDAA